MDKGFGLDQRIRRVVLEKNSPSAEERANIDRISQELVKEAKEVIHSLGLEDVEPMMAGSVAKGTMAKDPDLDMFLLFPYKYPNKGMEKMGMKIGRKLLKSPQRKYTQHPYLTGSFKGITCDIVPCYSIPKGSKILSAVDRTPHHTRYINTRLKEEQKEEVILLKAFLKGIGAYGAEDTVNGFSGYLVELLILKFGDFNGVVEFLSGLDASMDVPLKSELTIDHGFKIGRKPTIIFSEGSLLDEEPLEEDMYMKMFKNDVLIVIDPVDPRRNVAAPISLQTLALTIFSAKKLLDTPTEKIFHPFSRRPLRAVKNETGRADAILLFSLELPEGDPGIIITQLRRSLRRLKGEMERSGFEKVRIHHVLQFPPGSKIEQGYLRARYTWEGDVEKQRILFSIETEPSQLEPEYKHWGPPADNKRMPDFREKHDGSVMIDEASNRAYAILRREEVDPGKMIPTIWDSIKHGSRFTENELKRLDPEDIDSEILMALKGR